MTMKVKLSDLIKAIGGAMMLITMLTLIPFVWLDDKFWIKLLLSELIFIGIIYLLDKAITSREDE